MTGVGVGQALYELRKKIQNLSSELSIIDFTTNPDPHLINSTNLLRSNEILSSLNLKKSELILTYQQYSKELETMLEKILEIQKDLQAILKEQTSMISEQKVSKKRQTTKKKSKK